MKSFDTAVWGTAWKSFFIESPDIRSSSSRHIHERTSHVQFVTKFFWIRCFQWIIDLVLQYFTVLLLSIYVLFEAWLPHTLFTFTILKRAIRIFSIQDIYSFLIHRRKKVKWVWNDERARKWWHIFGWAISLNTTTEQCKHVNQTDVKP